MILDWLQNSVYEYETLFVRNDPSSYQFNHHMNENGLVTSKEISIWAYIKIECKTIFWILCFIAYWKILNINHEWLSMSYLWTNMWYWNWKIYFINEIVNSYLLKMQSGHQKCRLFWKAFRIGSKVTVSSQWNQA